jgi:glycerate kinase
LTILIAPDSFKGSLTAAQVAKAMAKGVRMAAKSLNMEKEIELKLQPISDGGDGFLEVLVASLPNCKKIPCKTVDALGRPIIADYGYIKAKNLAIIEMAASCGLTKIKEQDRDIFASSTYGVGVQMNHAKQLGATQFIISLGGSATNDGGAGMLEALGATYFDSKKLPISGIARNLASIQNIEWDYIFKKWENCSIHIATDVTNTLLGDNGASAVFAPQKGARNNQIALLEKGLKNWADVTEKTANRTIRMEAGTGAAGGLAFGLRFLPFASIHSGFKSFTKLVRLEQKITTVDLILTGEGSLDKQSTFGKAPYQLLELAKKHQKPIMAIAGSIDQSEIDFINEGFLSVHATMQQSLPFNQIKQHAVDWLTTTTANCIRLYLI